MIKNFDDGYVISSGSTDKTDMDETDISVMLLEA
jgi:hypothetical protein